MALKPTIYKARITLSDLNRHYYDTLNLTLAQHPSETLERMMVRVLAYCINADEQLAFTKGLDEADEPDIWLRTLDGQLNLWIDVGEPAVDRIKKAVGLSPDVKVYSFNTKSDVWWNQSQDKFDRLLVSVYRFCWQDIQSLVKLVERTMDISVTISDSSAHVTSELGDCEVNWETLQNV